MAKKILLIWREGRLIVKIYMRTVYKPNFAHPRLAGHQGEKVLTVVKTDWPHIKPRILFILALLVTDNQVLCPLSKQHPHSCLQC